MFKHGGCFSWETRDDISAECNIRPQMSNVLAERDSLSVTMAPLHTLENEIVSRLERKMQMRHQPWLVCQRIDEIGIDFHGINRGQPQTFKFGNFLEDAFNQ